MIHELVHRPEADRAAPGRPGADGTWPVLVTRFPPGTRAIATSVLGGGLVEPAWWLNAMVHHEYFEPDPVAHLHRIARSLGLPEAAGVGMLTAADVSARTWHDDGGVQALATVGLGVPTWAAAPEPATGSQAPAERVGTINILVNCPVPLSDAALVNAVLTLTEAKTQALLAAGVQGTGTASDAVCVTCPAPGGGAPGGDAPVEEYGGPRSRYGARVARAVHAAVAEGVERWRR